jgi:hypothetical protein
MSNTARETASDVSVKTPPALFSAWRIPSRIGCDSFRLFSFVIIVFLSSSGAGSPERAYLRRVPGPVSAIAGSGIPV